MTLTHHIPEFISFIQTSLDKNSLVKISLGHFKGKNSDVKNIYIRKILVKRQERLSFTYNHETRDIVKNYTIKESIQKIEAALNEGFTTATLFTTDNDQILSKNGIKTKSPSYTKLPSLHHDRNKQRLIETEGKPYLQALNITDSTGRVHKNAQDKYRQINKYVEILSTLIKDFQPEQLKRIIDMGAGKGYLTFALYDYLNSQNIKTHITGVEFRSDLVNTCNQIAQESNFTTLDFTTGSIKEYDCTDANILIALHACDTATDDALYKGITAKADLIVVAPCCHKQIRREIQNDVSKKATESSDLNFLLRYGIFLERQAEMVTDGLRALILEYYGYQTKVFEFISDAHTPKNIMIVGIRQEDFHHSDPTILNKIQKAKDFLGIKHHHLEKLLGI